jgi:hypothetical protein
MFFPILGFFVAEEQTKNDRRQTNDEFASNPQDNHDGATATAIGATTARAVAMQTEE